MEEGHISPGGEGHEGGVVLKVVGRVKECGVLAERWGIMIDVFKDGDKGVGEPVVQARDEPFGNEDEGATRHVVMGGRGYGPP